MKKQKLTFDSRIDYTLILPAFLLSMIGLLVLYIATNHDYPERLGKVMTQQATCVWQESFWRLLSCTLIQKCFGN